MIDLLCLANSIKYQERCIAGLRLDGQGWVRPVSRDRDSQGALSLARIRLNDGSSPQLLDVIRIGILEPCPAPYQPENWFIDSMPWQLVERPGDYKPLLESVDAGPELLGSRTDRSISAQFETSPALGSLSIVRPDSDHVLWTIGLDDAFRGRFRAAFALAGQRYDLSVTDPIWRDKLFRLGEGTYLNSDLGVRAGSPVYLVVSMGEPFRGFCYKLVASVILLSA